MSKLITLATFSNAAEVNIVKNVLEEEGIQAYIADQETVGMAWHLGNALGGIKLQVDEKSKQAAEAILERYHAETEDSLESGSAGSEISAEDAAGDEVDEQDLLTSAEQHIERAYKAAVVGLALIPLQLYSIYLLVLAVASGSPIGPAYRNKALATCAINFPIVVLILIFSSIMLSG